MVRLVGTLRTYMFDPVRTITLGFVWWWFCCLCSFDISISVRVLVVGIYLLYSIHSKPLHIVQKSSADSANCKSGESVVF